MFQTRDPVRDAVTNGADWLDVVYPEWVEHINLDSLELRCLDKCVLGQIFRTFYAFVPGLKFAWVIEHGFARASAGVDWDELQDAWIAEIITRKF